MPEINAEQLRQLIEQERQFARDLPPLPPREPPTIHYTELAAAPPDSPIATEWNFYRRQVGRLLAEGHEGKWVLIKGEQIVGMWATFEEAIEVQRSLPPAVLKQILTREPLLRIGYN
jgi:hypothetical protein